MTIIINPDTTPSVVYNPDGSSVVSVTATGTNQATGATIPYFTSYTMVFGSSADASHQALVLPTTASIGDLVEIFSTGIHAVTVFPGGSDTINNFASIGINAGSQGGFRRVSSSEWWVIY